MSWQVAGGNDQAWAYYSGCPMLCTEVKLGLLEHIMRMKDGNSARVPLPASPRLEPCHMSWDADQKIYFGSRKIYLGSRKNLFRIKK